MTEAFRCNGCGDYYDAAYRLLRIELERDAIRLADITLDDIPTDCYQVLEGSLNDEDTGDFCPTCGLKLINILVDAFVEVDDAA